MTGITIVLLVKYPSHMGKANIYYHDIGDYLDKEKKLKIISNYKSIEKMPFKKIKPNEDKDWQNQRSEIFKCFVPIEAENKFQSISLSFFITHSIGIKSRRDAWVYNFSEEKLGYNINKTIDFYNKEVDRYYNRENKDASANNFVNMDSKKFSWSIGTIKRMCKGEKFNFDDNDIILSIYRPFCKQKSYFNKNLNEEHSQNNRLFPTPKHQNIVITVTGKGNKKDFSCLISNCIPDLEIMRASQCFPFYYYEKSAEETPLFHFDATSTNTDTTRDQYTRKDAISDFILQKAKTQYGQQSITKEDIFYYVYGFLHSPSIEKHTPMI
ncbi:MAG: hypothetical protein OXC03_02775 [Flavobacteriaceae bacterium]|nr:hypothetical protein [Flavobacteriaceae bacterium]